MDIGILQSDICSIKMNISDEIVCKIQNKIDFESACLLKSIEKLQGQLEIFKNLLEMIQVDTQLCQEVLLPQLLTSFRNVSSLFTKIDQLESVVETIKDNIDLLEKEVTTAEINLSPVNPLKRLFQPLLSAVRETNITQTSSYGFTSPKIFNTTDLLSQIQRQSE
ncbi:uncharacterized protein LOC136042016 isoform X2 [Artemia franciscana]